jgi:hypothetical protein
MIHKEKIIEEIPYRFKVSGNLIKKLGEESIANKNIAVLELIKNSYDAKATKVDVCLENINTKDAKIVIIDNGEGMTNTDLENKWLNIATSNKVEKKSLNGERIPVGEKGIGRLSSESLGKETTLITKPKNESFGYKIIFDWTKYQGKNVQLNDVINTGYKIKKPKNERGTILEITDLKHNWNDATSQKSLLKDIYLLHPPINKPKNFKVATTIKIPGLKKIDKSFLQNAAYSIKVNLTNGNTLKYEAKAISGKNVKGTIETEKKFICGDASLELYFFYRKSEAQKAALGVDISTQKIKEITKTLDEYYGIKIYRDGFRVKPYGESGNDWLGLDLSFQNNTIYPRNNNVFGFVNISKTKNPKISDTTTREGIIYSEEFLDLISFIKTSLQEIFIEFRSEIEKHKKKARKTRQRKKKKITPVPAQPNPSSSDKLIKNLGGAYPQNFYSILEQEINDCYEKNYSNAAFFLCRKLVENLIFNILEKKYPVDEALWYSSVTRNHHKLSLLISNLYSKKQDFKVNVQTYIEKFNSLVGLFRKESNSKAHNIFEYLSDKSELKKFKINDLIQLLLNIYHNC